MDRTRLRKCFWLTIPCCVLAGISVLLLMVSLHDGSWRFIDRWAVIPIALTVIANAILAVSVAIIVSKINKTIEERNRYLLLRIIELEKKLEQK